MDRQRAVAARPQVVGGVGLAVAGAFVASLLVLMQTTTYDTWGGLLVGPALVAVSLPAFARQAAREGDRRLFWLLLLALILKLCGSLARLYIAYGVYGTGADAAGYHDSGVALAERFRAGNFDTGLESLVGTNFVRLLAGIVYTVIGPSRLGGYLVFSWLAFWGLFSFYRAITIAVPEGRARTYAHLLFFLPSVLFWPSSIGKDAWMVFTLGTAAFGAALLLSGRTWRGLAIAGSGLWLAAMVRPHIAGMLGLALAVVYLLHRPWKGTRRLSIARKAVALAGLILIAFLLVSRTEEFLQESNIDPRAGVTVALQEVSSRTGQGGSQFVPSILDSPGRAPIAVATVLFRPFPMEAHNTQALVSALEATFLLLLTLIRFRWLLAAVRSIRRQAYVAFAIAYTGLFVLGFSSIGNFGILARERVQLLPLYLVLVAIPPRASGTEPTRRAAPSGAR